VIGCAGASVSRGGWSRHNLFVPFVLFVVKENFEPIGRGRDGARPSAGRCSQLLPERSARRSDPTELNRESHESPRMNPKMDHHEEREEHEGKASEGCSCDWLRRRVGLRGGWSRHNPFVPFVLFVVKKNFEPGGRGRDGARPSAGRCSQLLSERSARRSDPTGLNHESHESPRMDPKMDHHEEREEHEGKASEECSCDWRRAHRSPGWLESSQPLRALRALRGEKASRTNRPRTRRSSSLRGTLQPTPS
jgi:hypothetical protein